jgi:molecular chaperone GrpE
MDKIIDQNTNEEMNQEDNSIPIERVESASEPVNIQPNESEQKENELKTAQAKNSELEKQVVDLKDSLLRKVAEFENYKRRNEVEQMNLLKYAAEPFIRQVLGVYDDLERSLSHIDDENNFESMKKGLQLVFDKFNKTLDAQGVKKIEAKDQPFNVEFHEALMQRQVEGVAPHTVLEVIEPGYLYKDKVIRHAKVIVSAELASPENPNINEG